MQERMETPRHNPPEERAMVHELLEELAELGDPKDKADRLIIARGVVPGRILIRIARDMRLAGELRGYES